MASSIRREVPYNYVRHQIVGGDAKWQVHYLSTIQACRPQMLLDEIFPDVLEVEMWVSLFKA